MFPIGDDDSAERTVPVVTYLLIALNVLFFFVELSGGDPFIERWSVVPRRLMANPGADWRRGSGGNRSSFDNAIGPGFGCFAPCALKNLNSSHMPAETAIVANVSTTANVSTARTLMSLVSCVTSTLRMCETSGVSVRCPLPLCLSFI